MIAKGRIRTMNQSAFIWFIISIIGLYFTWWERPTGGASGFEVVICVISIVILGSTVSHFAKVYFWLPRQLRQLEKEYSKEELLQLQDEALQDGVISSPVFSDSGDGSSASLYEDLKEVKGCGAVTARKIVNKIDNSQTLTNREEELLKKAGWEVE